MNNFDDQILLACLDAMEAGENPETVLARHPEQADTIRRILALDKGLAGLAVAPPAGAQARSETMFLAQAAALKSVANRSNGSLPWWRLLLASFAALVLVLAISVGAMQASADSLPGDALYSVKRLNEVTRLRFSNDPQGRHELEETFENERIREVIELLRLGRNEAVECSGEIEVLAFDYVQVYGLIVETDEKTVINGKLELGAEATIVGYTEDGRYVAESITIMTPNEPDLLPASSPEPGPTSTVEPTDTATATETATAESTGTAEATPTLQTTTTSEPSATSTPDPEQTGTPEIELTETPEEEEEEEECDSSGPGNDCEEEEEEEEECDSSGSGNNCDDDDDDPDDEDDDPDDDDDDPDDD